MVTIEHEDQRTADQAFTETVEQYSDLAYNVALRMLRNAENAEDAVQEAFISAHRSFSTFRGQSKLSTWLYRIVVNACLMQIRKEKTHKKYLSETDYEDVVLEDWSNEPQAAANNGELRSVLEEGLVRLAPNLRAVVVLRDMQELSNQEAAEVLGASVPTVKSRLHRGRVLLRQHLREYLANSDSGVASPR